MERNPLGWKQGAFVAKQQTTSQPAPQSDADVASEAEECSHTWEIGRPNQQVSPGRCIKCGAEKDFLNSGEELRMPFGRRRRS